MVQTTHTRPERLAASTKRQRGPPLYNSLLPLPPFPAQSYLSSFLSAPLSPYFTPSNHINAVYDECSAAIWVTAEKEMEILWRRGFFGKGALSRSEPSWKKRVENCIEDAKGGVIKLTAEEMTAQRRKDRRVTKLVKKAEREAEKLAAASASAASRGLNSGVIPSIIEEEEDGDEDVDDEDEEEEEEEEEELEADDGVDAEATIDTPTIEGSPIGPPSSKAVPPLWHLRAEPTQLQPEEAFFLAFALGTLSLRTSNPLALLPTPLSAPLSLLEMWRLFLHRGTTSPRKSLSETTERAKMTRWDAPFLLNYVAYHHYRSMGWVVRSGVKFCADWVLYGPGGPVGGHAEFAIVVIPTYADPADAPPTPAEGRAEGEDRTSWRWFNTVNRVCSGVKKTLVLLYITIPPMSTLPSTSFIEEDPARALASFQVREVTVRRWIAGRMRD